MIQTIVVIVLIGLALGYLGRSLYRHFTTTGCASGCGKCSSIDLKKIERDLVKRGF